MRIKKGIAVICATIIAFTFMITPAYAARDEEMWDDRIWIAWEVYTNWGSLNNVSATAIGECDNPANLRTVTAEMYRNNALLASSTNLGRGTYQYVTTKSVTINQVDSYRAKGIVEFNASEIIAVRSISEYGAFPSHRSSFATTALGETYGSAYGEDEP